MPSSLESKFQLLWKHSINGPALESEQVLLPPRKWRVDFVHRASKTIVELEGGVWSGGRHTRGSGFSKDCEKYNELTFAGFTIFRLTNEQITTVTLDRIRYHIERRMLKSDQTKTVQSGKRRKADAVS